MKKFLLPIFMGMLMLAFAGCADDSENNNGGGSDGSSASNIVSVDESVTIKVPADTRIIQSVILKNPRAEQSDKVYPILISPAMGMNGKGGAEYFVYFASENFGLNTSTMEADFDLTYYAKSSGYTYNGMYNLSTGSLAKDETGKYYIMFDAWNNANYKPSSGYFVFAFLTEAEAAEHLKADSLTDKMGIYNGQFLSSDIIDKLKAIDNGNALKQYKWTADTE